MAKKQRKKRQFVNFKGHKESLERVFGKVAMTPRAMVKKLLKFVAKHKLLLTNGAKKKRRRRRR